MDWSWVILLIMFGIHLIAVIGLEQLNQRHVQSCSGQIPETFRSIFTPDEYAQSIEYTLAKSKFLHTSSFYSTAILIALLSCGILPILYRFCVKVFHYPVVSDAAFIFVTITLIGITDLPWDWFHQFRLEERFGFNTTTQRLWWIDQIKDFVLGLILIFPLFMLIFSIVQWGGVLWWLWAWLVVLVFQLMMILIAPVLILPLFNKFTPLPEGNLKHLIGEIANKAGIQFNAITVMDGSKRSRHSNAFFTGLGRYRTIALFDTLITHCEESEIAAVVAHEMVHLKKRHILKQFLWRNLELLAGFYLAANLLHQSWLVQSIGFETGNITAGFFMLYIWGSLLVFWITPLKNLLSRKYEYEADHFAVKIIGTGTPLIRALRKLHKENLSNANPHPLYSAFYYSHPTLTERENVLNKIEK